MRPHRTNGAEAVPDRDRKLLQRCVPVPYGENGAEATPPLAIGVKEIGLKTKNARVRGEEMVAMIRVSERFATLSAVRKRRQMKENPTKKKRIDRRWQRYKDG